MPGFVYLRVLIHPDGQEHYTAFTDNGPFAHGEEAKIMLDYAITNQGVDVDVEGPDYLKHPNRSESYTYAIRMLESK